MKSTSKCFFGGVLIATVTSLGSSAGATSSRLPSVHVARDLVTPQETLRFDAGHRWPQYDGQFKHVMVEGGDDPEYINPGFTYGFAEDFEAGLVLPLQIAPGTELEDPRIHALYQFERGRVDLGVFGSLRLGLFDAWLLTGGVPVFFHWSDNLRLDTGGFLELSLDAGQAVGLVFPAQFVFQVSPSVFLGPETGLRLSDVAGANSVSVPAGVFVGYTFGSAGSTVGDIYGRFRIPNVEDGVDVIELMLGTELYFDM
jgi:hypothetical protein